MRESNISKTNFLIFCIGNRDGGDDAVGPLVADLLKKEKIEVVDCGTTPENYTSVVKKINPEMLIIVDAADIGLKPGEIRIVPKEKIGVMTISTHGIPLSILMNYLEQTIKKVVLIGIQPKIMSGNMTDIVKKSAERLIKIIKKKEISQIEILQ